MEGKEETQNSNIHTHIHTPANPPNCPECSSKRLYKDGFRQLRDGSSIQRWLCRECGFRFSNSDSRNNTYRKCLTNRDHQICVFKEAKNLASTTENKTVGDLQFADTRAELIQFAIHLRKQGRQESTAVGQSKLLRIIWQRGAILSNPESVKETIANQKGWCPGRKENAVDAYTNFLLMHGMKWNPPQYQRVEKIPFIPTEKELDNLIAGCGKKTATFLQLLKETGIRAGEAWQLEWKDIDAETRIIRVKPEKGSNPRAPRISEKLLAMINALRKNSGRIFGTYTLNGFAASYYRQRKTIALKLQNPKISQITFHTFRHWKATMEYHRTKDILYVMKLLGHKNIKNTLIYTQLLPFNEDEQFICKVAENTKEACQLIEDGWEYVTGEYSDGGKIFRKPK
jgi:site-specific recombinase XerD